MKADINVTPLIDVLLVLLIIFMLVAPVAPRALEASLPSRSEGPSDPAPASLVLEVRADTFALNTSPVLTLEDLERRLRTAFATRGDGTLFVRVEGGVAYERAVAAIDAAHGAGASRIGLVEDQAPRNGSTAGTGQ
jgi:biopolymer transport protein ExbD